MKILSVKGVRITLAAPTGRAAKRLSESTGLEAKTMHPLLEVDPMHGGFRRKKDHPLDCDLLVVDETSMIDVRRAVDARPADGADPGRRRRSAAVRRPWRSPRRHHHLRGSAGG